MKKLILVFVAVLAVSSCDKEELAEEVSIETTLLNDWILSKKSSKKSNKVAVYHKKKKVIYVNENALSAHIQHGDGVDLDGDGYFDKENSVSEGIDCDDNNPDVNPGAEEIFTDDIDNNCNGIIGYVVAKRVPTQCTDCTAGTSGNYKNPSNGKCKQFPSFIKGNRKFSEECYKIIYTYVD